METPKLIVSMSPHLRGPLSIERMMLTVMVGLIPSALAGIYFFGITSLMLMVVAMATAVIVETLIEKLTGQTLTYHDYHALLIGLLLALILPPTAPWWIAAVGALVAVILGKMVFGGLGTYPFNPVIVAWVVLKLSWPERMELFVDPHSAEQVLTPLMAIKEDPALLYSYELRELFFGNQAGPIGTGCAPAIILGGLWLLYRGVIRWHIPIAFLLGVAVFAGIVHAVNPDLYPPLSFHLLGGGVLLAALFLAPEPVTSPVTPTGMLAFGFLAGILTMIIRMWGAHPDGSFYAILIMNAATPLLNHLKPRSYGRSYGA